MFVPKASYSFEPCAGQRGSHLTFLNREQLQGVWACLPQLWRNHRITMPSGPKAPPDAATTNVYFSQRHDKCHLLQRIHQQKGHCEEGMGKANGFHIRGRTIKLWNCSYFKIIAMTECCLNLMSFETSCCLWGICTEARMCHMPWFIFIAVPFLITCPFSPTNKKILEEPVRCVLGTEKNYCPWLTLVSKCAFISFYCHFQKV